MGGSAGRLRPRSLSAGSSRRRRPSRRRPDCPCGPPRWSRPSRPGRTRPLPAWDRGARDPATGLPSRPPLVGALSRGPYPYAGTRHTPTAHRRESLSLWRERRRRPPRAQDPLPRESRRDGRPQGPRATTSSRSATASRPGSRSRRPAARATASCNRLIREENLHTVCQEAACPNVGDCWDRGTATFMILGDTCTRRCGFCNVKTGKPTWNDPLEPARVARSVARMGLRHAVITSVDRDDLPDYGASAFVGVIRQIRRQAPRCKVEVLTPDFRGAGDAAREGHRRAARRLQPQRRGRAAPVPDRPPRLEVPALLPGAAQRQGDGRRRGVDEVGPDGRPRRDARRARRRVRRPARARRPGPDRRAVPAPDARTICRSCATGIPTSSRRSSGPPTPSASSTSPPARSCGRATTPTSTCRSASRGPARSRSRPDRRRAGTAYDARSAPPSPRRRSARCRPPGRDRGDREQDRPPARRPPPSSE